MHVVSHLLRTLSSHTHIGSRLKSCPYFTSISTPIHGCLSLTRPTPLSTSQPSSCLSSSSLSSTLSYEQQPELNKKIMENLCDSANNGSEGTYDVLYLPTGYEPNGQDFNELQNSSVPLSLMIPSSDQDVDDLTLGEMLHSSVPRTSRLLRTRRRVSQSVVVVCNVR